MLRPSYILINASNVQQFQFDSSELFDNKSHLQGYNTDFNMQFQLTL